VRSRIAPLAIATLVLALPSGVGGQDSGRDRDAYHEAVARFFEVAREEVDILADWPIPSAEVPVVLFLADQAGISPDAAASARTRGSSWQGLMQRYGVQVSTLYMTLGSGAPLGPLESVYARLDETPRGAWNRLQFTDAEVMGLINLRVLTVALRVPPARVLEAWQSAGRWHLVPLALANSR